jgi:pimeloyl-ACP methyl ester carboxylesterase
VGREVRPRILKISVLNDVALSGLAMPILAILGGKDVLLDTADAKRRLERFVPHAEVRHLPEARHVIPGQTGAILEFLLSTRDVAVRPEASGHGTASSV